jgi:hypothetical protein
MTTWSYIPWRGMTADVEAPVAPEAPTEGAVREGRVRRFGRKDGHLWPLLLLAGLTTGVWGWPVLRDFAGLRLSNPGDSESFAYYLSWNVHALTHGLNPFFTPNLYAPDGLDLGNAISVPSVSILVAPVTAVFGGTAGYNAAFLLAIFASGAAVYLLARELWGSSVGAGLAGALMIVSPYFSGHGLGHLNLMWVFGLPLLAYLVVRYVGGRLRRRWLVLPVALTVAFTIGASTELFVTESVFAAVALAVAVVFATSSVRSRLLTAMPWLALGGTLGVVLGSPVILAGLRSGIPETVANPPALYPTDVANVVAPTGLTLLGDNLFTTLREDWLGNEAENTAYIPVTLLLLVAAVVLLSRRRSTLAITVFAGLTFVCSLGPYLTLDGAQTIPMPWRIATAIPGLDHALPSRFSAFVFVALALLVAQAWSTRLLPRWLVAGAASISCVLMLPNLPVMMFPVDASVPSFVTSGRMAELIDEGENVLILPAGQWGPGMRWMDELDFSFEMPTGNGGGAKAPPMLKEPIGAALYFQDFEYDFKNELLPYLEDVGVDTVIVDAGQQGWKAVMDEVLPGAGQAEDEVWVYRIP